MLNIEVRNRLISTLLLVGPAASRAGRDQFLVDLPANLVAGLNRSETNARQDISQIVAQLEMMERISASGEVPLILFARAALSYIEGTSLGDKLESIIRALEAQPVREEAPRELHELLWETHSLALAADPFHDCRSRLLASIEPDVVARIRDADTPGVQLFEDLSTLARHETQGGGPLVTWLRCACLLGLLPKAFVSGAEAILQKIGPIKTRDDAVHQYSRATRMIAQDGILQHTTIISLHESLIQSRYDRFTWHVALIHLPKSIEAQLRFADNMSDQLLSDLFELNRLDCTSDGLLPLEMVLRTIINLNGSEPTPGVFADALGELKNWKRKDHNPILAWRPGCLSAPELDTLYAICMEVRFFTPDMRRTLLLAVDAVFVASLPTRSNASDQFRSDIDRLNCNGRLQDGTVPLADWLFCTSHMLGPRIERRTVEELLEKVIAEFNITDSNDDTDVRRDAPLSIHRIFEIYDNFIKNGLLARANIRSSLLTGIAPAVLGSLAKCNSPAAQLWSDLAHLNQIGILVDGTVPLQAWLQHAAELAGLLTVSELFMKAHADVWTWARHKRGLQAP